MIPLPGEWGHIVVHLQRTAERRLKRRKEAEGRLARCREGVMEKAVVAAKTRVVSEQQAVIRTLRRVVRDIVLAKLDAQAAEDLVAQIERSGR